MFTPRGQLTDYTREELLPNNLTKMPLELVERGQRRKRAKVFIGWYRQQKREPGQLYNLLDTYVTFK